MTRRAIDYRDARLVRSLVDALFVADGPFPEAVLVAGFATEWTPETVKRTLRDLVDFGALRRLTPLRQPPAYRMTPLGRAWADRRVEPYVGARGDEDDVSPSKFDVDFEG